MRNQSTWSKGKTVALSLIAITLLSLIAVVSLIAGFSNYIFNNRTSQESASSEILDENNSLEIEIEYPKDVYEYTLFLENYPKSYIEFETNKGKISTHKGNTSSLDTNGIISKKYMLDFENWSGDFEVLYTISGGQLGYLPKTVLDTQIYNPSVFQRINPENEVTTDVFYIRESSQHIYKLDPNFENDFEPYLSNDLKICNAPEDIQIWSKLKLKSF
jgi:hypothetical protein